ncbi:TonB-dependent receptor domain-containing protein [Sphingoaurantiacus capsulatus]|uniref:TonB-dependent receptor domain-containing protein n=1 Tax=Sphingoaurantiacus capsulatus TaxID=1771310 RepID=A0ABV7XCA2_9SPHN
MKKPLALGSALLVSTILASPVWAQGSAPAAPAQATPEAAPAPQADPNAAATEAAPAAPAPAAAEADAAQDDVDISTVGGSDGEEIVVRGRYIPNSIRATPAVISVLSPEDIARTGEGDIAGALQRVPGLSVVSGGFVYVRGLGDRYSLSLLNGSPLPSPEPLRRVVPLDIFPTSIVASALVQKSYSPNYPGEFGGGVINLTTVATPRDPFLGIGLSVGLDTETTGQLGYTYKGGDRDWLGYDDGTRKLTSAIREAGVNGTDVTDPAVIIGLSNAETTLLQRNDNLPANFSAELNGGTSFDKGDYTIGLVAGAGYNSSWQTRDSLQQSTTDPTGALEEEFRTVLTDNRVLVNGLLGLGLEVEEHKFRLTNVYIHDTVKQGRLASGYDARNFPVPAAGDPNPQIEQNTSFFERELYDLQGVAELKFENVNVDLRGTYAKTRRDSPYERYFGYVYNATIGDYQNRLTGSDTESATIAFSELDERIWAGGADLTYKFDSARPISLSVGGAYSDTDRTSSRYFFRYRGPSGGNVNDAVAQQRPDYLISDFNVQTYGLTLDNQSASQAASAYDAGLEVKAGYAMLEAELADGFRVSGGVRYEDASQFVTAGAFTRTLANDYWLPALTVTWNFAEDQQFRLHGSKTLARPQFRELAPQLYQDFSSDREFIGNPFLEDSQLYNAEARYENFLGRDERLTVAGFWKKIDNPIEAVAFFQPDGTLQTGFSNAPEATLYGAEFELQKFIPLDGWGGDFWSTRRVVLIANYTYSKSELKVGDESAVSPIVGATLTPTPIPANLLFRDGAALTGQSDHLVNLQVGLENTEKLSQAMLLFTYGSDRVTNRGPVSFGQRLPDLIEKPGVRLDFVLRQGVQLVGKEVELKFEARNLTGEKSREVQEFDGGQVIDINTYDLGRTFSLSASLKF